MVKLSTGREVEVKSLTVDQRVEIDDSLAAYYYKLGVNMADSDKVASAPFSFAIGLRAVKMVSSIPEDLTNGEILEWFNLIFDASHLTDLQKKS